MNVLFAHSFFMAFDEKQRTIREPYPPLGTLIAAACAAREGFQTSLFDAMLAEDTRAFKRKLEQDHYEVVVFFEDNFNWLTKMCLNRMRQACGEMIGMAREKGARILVVGSDASDFPAAFLEMGADYVIKGEAEFRVLDILNHYRQGKHRPCSGPGIFRLENGIPTGEPPLRGERDLARFPIAAWDLVDIEAYRRVWRESHGYFSLNMMTTRGCPYRCNWCAKPIHGRRYDVRDPIDCAREMDLLKKKHRPDHIWFTDDIFGLKPGWVARFSEEVQRLEAQIPFKIQVRADLMNPESVQALKAAGCQTVWMGAESGSQKVLDAMDKNLKVENTRMAAQLLKEAGIEVCFFLQFGYPGESVEDIRRTWLLVAESKPDQIGISVAYPLPGTKFHDAVKDQLPADQDHWEHSQFMKPLHQTPYPADFYPELYRYFHHLFRGLKNPDRDPLRRIKDYWSGLRIRGRLKRFGVAGVPFA